VRIVVNHLTRMRSGRICIAGIDLERSRHVRPVTPKTDVLTRDLPTENGGPLELAALVDIGQPAPVPHPPETEDHRVATRDLKRVRTLDADEYLQALHAIAVPDLETLSGQPCNAGNGSTPSTKVTAMPRRPWSKRGADPNWRSTGTGSCGCVSTTQIPTFVSVADIRFVEPDHSTVRTDIVDDVHARLQRGIGVYVMFGLSRAFTATGDDQDRHWLQVNGLCLEDRPVGGMPQSTSRRGTRGAAQESGAGRRGQLGSASWTVRSRAARGCGASKSMTGRSQTRMISTKLKLLKSASWVTTAASWCSAVAAIQVSWRRGLRPARRCSSASRAKHDAVAPSIGSSG
jgi:hypothetical protein